MVRKQQLIGISVALALALGVSPGSWANGATNQAFQVDVKLSAATEQEITSNIIKLARINITTKDIINIALDQPAGTTVPTNIVLALIINCSDDEGALAVVDTSTMTVYAGISPLTADGSADSRGRGVAALAITNWDTGGISNRFSSGWVAVSANIQLADLETNDCPLVSFKANSGTGVLEGVRGGENFKLTITKASMKTVRSLGYVDISPL